MPAVAFDKDTYRKAVLDPARKAGNALPADLFERYGLDQVRLSSEAEFAAHLKEVVAYWRVLRQRSRVYAKLIEALLAAHQELERAGRLTLRYFQEESRRRREENERKLQEMVAAMAATTPCLDPQALEELIALGGGPACAPRLRRLLAEHKIRLVDRPWELPSDPPSRPPSTSGCTSSSSGSACGCRRRWSSAPRRSAAASGSAPASPSKPVRAGR